MTATHFFPLSLRSSGVASLFAAAALFVGGCRAAYPYETCSSNADCSGSTTCRAVSSTGERICTDSCTTNADCPYDSYGNQGQCLSFDSGVNFSCWQACTTSSVCSGSLLCSNNLGGTSFSPVCIPAAYPYDPCDDSIACGDGTSCQTISTAGDQICTTSCAYESDCPADYYGAAARCLSFDGGSNFSCWQACNASGSGSECPAGYYCASSANGQSIPPICLPS